MNKTLEQQRIIQQFKIQERVLHDAKAPLNHNQSANTITSGVLNADRLGTGSALQVLRRNAANDALEFATSTSGGAVTASFTVDFADEDTYVEVTVTDAAITATSKIFGAMVGEEAAILGMQVNNLSSGTGACALAVSAPNGATGTYAGTILIA